MIASLILLWAMIWAAGAGLTLVASACTDDGRNALRLVAQDTPGTWALAAAFFAVFWPAILIDVIRRVTRRDLRDDIGGDQP